MWLLSWVSTLLFPRLMIIYIRACFVFVFAVTWSLSLQGEVGEHGQKGAKGGKGEHVSDADWQFKLFYGAVSLSISWVLFCCFAHCFCACFLCVGRVLLVHLGQWVPSVSPVLLWVQVLTLLGQNQRVWSASWFYLYFLLRHAANSVQAFFLRQCV